MTLTHDRLQRGGYLNSLIVSCALIAVNQVVSGRHDVVQAVSVSVKLRLKCLVFLVFALDVGRIGNRFITNQLKKRVVTLSLLVEVKVEYDALN